MIEQCVFIVSGDLRKIVGRWLHRGQRFMLPDKEIFEHLQEKLIEKLKSIFEPINVEVVVLEWDYLKIALSLLIKQKVQDLPIISLDRIYVDEGIADIYFDANRLVKFSKHDAESDWYAGWSDIGHGPRPESPSIVSQIDRIIQQGKIRKMRSKRVAIVDDGTWTRGSLLTLQATLESFGIKVEKFFIGVEIHSKDDQQVKQLLDAKLLEWVDLFYKENVIDWVGERDFFPGVGYSGRTLGESFEPDGIPSVADTFYTSVPMQGNYGAPYVLPFGDPIAWANIPKDQVAEFSKFCLQLTIELYKAIEDETKRVTGSKDKIKIQDLERPPFFLRKLRDHSIVEELKRSIEIVDTLF